MQVFTDWKSQVRKRARLIRNAAKETGNKGEPVKHLTELEKKLLYLTGDIVVEGISGIPELGVENERNIEIAIQEETKEKAEERQMKESKALKKTLDTKFLSEINSNLNDF